jgi:undecaprenyl-diphosphatase
MVSLAFFGLLAFFLSQKIQRGNVPVWVSAVFIIGWVGASRVFLGSHWLSDVIAGYAFGLLWISGTLVVVSRWSSKAAGISERSHA